MEQEEEEGQLVEMRRVGGGREFIIKDGMVGGLSAGPSLLVHFYVFFPSFPSPPFIKIRDEGEPSPAARKKKEEKLVVSRCLPMKKSQRKGKKKRIENASLSDSVCPSYSLAFSTMCVLCVYVCTEGATHPAIFFC